MSATQPELGLEAQLGSLRSSLLKLARRFADRTDAEDFVQEALARALERPGAFRPGTDVRGWMKPVIRNLAIDDARRRKRLLPLDEARAAQRPAPPPAPAWANLDIDHVWRSLAGCSEELRTAFELHYGHRLSLEAIAARVGVRRATVGTRLFRARAQVRRALERDVLR